MAASAALALALLSLGACKNKSPQGMTDGGEDAESASPPVVISASNAPADGGLTRLATTSWNIAGGNLDADIADRLKRDAGDVGARLHLVDQLLTRAQFLADVADYERAEKLATESARNYPKDGAALFMRALVHGALHRFDAALKDLDAAEALKADPDRIASTRASIYAATGRYDEAEKILPAPNAKSRPHVLVVAATLAGQMQKHDEAERLFEQARSSFVDVTPFPIAWMDFQRATLLEARGKEKEARAYYLEAFEKIPVYAHAAVHLAATDPPAEAIARLEAVRKTTPDPDVLAALADAYHRAKNDSEAKRITDLARARYDELVTKYPEAYRDHAARFYLRGGNDPKKALALAEKNAQLRPTEEAIDLWMASAAAVNDKAKMCAAATAMSQLRWISPERKRLAAATSSSCPDAAAK
jgi:tetratricopeptide (TPR) repeat protein